MPLLLLSKDDVPLDQIGDRLVREDVGEVRCVDLNAFVDDACSSVHDDLIILITQRHDYTYVGDLVGQVRSRLTPEQRLVLCMPRPIDVNRFLSSGADEVIVPAGQSSERVFERILGHLILSKRVQPYSFELLKGGTKSMRDLYQQIEQQARLRDPVLILGETGTGKALVANAIHTKNGAQRQFQYINCAALSTGLVGSDLFGHVKGAFTGADKDRVGRIEAAKDGTVFFDEIGDMDLQSQAALLDVLDNRRILPVGDNHHRSVYARFLFGTNQNLKERIGKNRFREDLFARIRVLVLRLPPLRERMADVPLLFKHFVERYSKKNEMNLNIDPFAIDELFRYDWRRNVRALEHMIPRLAALAGRTGRITDIALQECIRDESASDQRTMNQPRNTLSVDPLTESWREVKEKVEEKYFTLLFDDAKNLDEASQRSGMQKSRLHDMRKKYVLNDEDSSCEQASDS